MTIKNDTIYVTAKEIKDAGIVTGGVNELEDALLAAGYELSIEPSDVR